MITMCNVSVTKVINHKYSERLYIREINRQISRYVFSKKSPSHPAAWKKPNRTQQQKHQQNIVYTV